MYVQGGGVVSWEAVCCIKRTIVYMKRVGGNKVGNCMLKIHIYYIAYST